MDVSDRVAAWATAYVMENPGFTNKGLSCISWAATVYPYVALGLSEIEYSVGKVEFYPEGTQDGLDQIQEDVEYLRNLSGEVERQENSALIGGPEVEAEVAEVTKLLEAQQQARDEQAADIKTMKEAFREAHGDDSPEQRAAHEEQLSLAEELAQQTLAKEQETELQALQARQVEMQEQELEGQEMSALIGGPGVEAPEGQEKSTLIGGPEVEAEVAEVTKLLEAQQQARDEQAADIKTMKEAFREAHGDDSPEQRAAHEEQLALAEELAQQTLAKEQETELQALQARQVEMQEQELDM